MNKNKGFTLIELLVVIAIIGILASVVLASLSSARSKSQDAAIQSQLSSMRAQAELYYSTTGLNSYMPSGGAAPASGGCTGGTAPHVFTGVNSLSTLLTAVTTTKDCGVSATAWSVAAAGVTSGTYYCVDSTGVSRSTNTSGTAYDSVTGGTTPAHASAGATSCS